MKNGKFLLLAAASIMLAACGKTPVVKTGEAVGLVHGAGYVGYATVTVTDDKITAATLTEYCFPSHVTAEAAEEGKTVDVQVTSHGTTSTKHYYKEVKFGSYTFTATAEGYKTADGKTEKELFANDAAAKAWKEAVVAGNVDVNGVKTIMTNKTLCKDENGYGGSNFDWKGNRDKTVAAFVAQGKKLTEATFTKTVKVDNKDKTYWVVGDVDTGATWVDLNSRKDGTLSYAELLVKALDAVK